MSSFPELFLTWDGTEYRCRPTMDVLTHIEQRVPLQKLANTVVSDPESIPMSHVAWVMYCLLRGSGAQVTAEQVWAAIREQEVTQDDIVSTLKFVVAETFGSGPEKPPKKAGKAGKQKASRRSD